MSMRLLLLIGGFPGWAEVLVIVFIGLLLFGRRLPEVGRSVGKTIVEFKKGIREVEAEVDVASRPGKGNKRALPPAEEKVPAQLEGNTPEAVKPAAVKPETVKPETVKPETAQPPEKPDVPSNG